MIVKKILFFVGCTASFLCAMDRNRVAQVRMAGKQWGLSTADDKTIANIRESAQEKYDVTAAEIRIAKIGTPSWRYTFESGPLEDTVLLRDAMQTYEASHFIVYIAPDQLEKAKMDPKR